MRFSLVVLATLTGFAVAQSPSSGASSSSSCQAQNIVEACLSTTNLHVQNCRTQDWGCLCSAYGSVLTCFDNCPGDPNRFAVEQQRVANCNAADAVSAASSRASAATAVTTNQPAATTTTTGSAAQTTGTGNETDKTETEAETTAGFTTGSSTAAATGATGAASPVTLPAVGGLFALLVGFAGLL